MAIREIDNGYYVEVYLGINPVTGKKDRATMTFSPRSRKNLAAAKSWEVKIKEKYDNGEFFVSGNIALRIFLDEWYEKFVKDIKAYTTQQKYKRHIECVKEHLGNVKLDKLKTKMVDDLYSTLKKEMKTFKSGKTKRRYSDGTILQIHKTFRMAVEQAVVWEMITKNYVSLAKPPQEIKKEKDTWTIEEIELFLSKAKGTVMYLPTLIAYHTGLREGEISALRWEDVNLKEGYIMVSHNMVQKKKVGIVLEKTKTPASEAMVALTNTLTSVLKSVLKEQKKRYLRDKIKSDYVCCWEDGIPLRPLYISRRFTELVKKFGMKKITFHDLRHSHATILYESGARSNEISKRLRHSRVSITDDIYIHIKDKVNKSTANLFDKAVKNAK